MNSFIRTFLWLIARTRIPLWNRISGTTNIRRKSRSIHIKKIRKRLTCEDLGEGGPTRMGGPPGTMGWFIRWLPMMANRPGWNWLPPPNIRFNHCPALNTYYRYCKVRISAFANKKKDLNPTFIKPDPSWNINFPQIYLHLGREYFLNSSRICTNKTKINYEVLLLILGLWRKKTY